MWLYHHLHQRLIMVLANQSLVEKMGKTPGKRFCSQERWWWSKTVYDVYDTEKDGENDTYARVKTALTNSFEPNIKTSK